MAITQIDLGGSAPAPIGPLKVRLDASADVALTLTDVQSLVDVQPAGVVSAREVLFVPQGQEVLVKARRKDGRTFDPGDMVGVTVSSPSLASPGIVVRVPVDAGGRAEITLLRISGSIPRVTLSDPLQTYPGHAVVGPSGGPDTTGGSGQVPVAAPTPPALSPLKVSGQAWHSTGAYGYHAHHSASQSGAWALLVDSGASMLVGRPRAEVGRLIEVVYGIAMAARGGGPHTVGLCRDSRVADFSVALDVAVPDWESILAVTPAPWSRLLPSLRQASATVGSQGLVVAIVDGEPVDTEETVAWLASTPAAPRTCVVGLGRSRFDIEESGRTLNWWEDDMNVLGGLAEISPHRLLTIQNLSGVTQAAESLADALFPR